MSRVRDQNSSIKFFVTQAIQLAPWVGISGHPECMRCLPLALQAFEISPRVWSHRADDQIAPSVGMGDLLG